MPVKKRTPKARQYRITEAAIEAWRAGDYRALHRALGLKPWEASPLPLSITPLGVDQEPGPGDPTLHSQSWPQAQELQRELIRVAGHPQKETRQ